MSISISRSMSLFAAFVCGGIVHLIAISGIALHQMQVTGPIYQKIADGKDLLGDILPPPEYVIEAYLEANLAARDPTSLRQHKARLTQLHHDYDDRRSYWKASRLDDTLKAELTSVSDVQVQAFWNDLEGHVLPAIQQQDEPAITASMNELGLAYTAHRKIIDDVVSKATTMDNVSEAAAKPEAKAYSAALYGGGLTVLCLLFGGIFLMRRKVVVPIIGMTSYMDKLARGDYEQPVPYATRADEIGGMATSVSVFRAAVLERRSMREQNDREAFQMERRRVAIEGSRPRRPKDRKMWCSPSLPVSQNWQRVSLSFA